MIILLLSRFIILFRYPWAAVFTVAWDLTIFRVGFRALGEFAFDKSMSVEESFCAGRGGSQVMRNIQRYKKGGGQTSANDTRSAVATPLGRRPFKCDFVNIIYVIYSYYTLNLRVFIKTCIIGISIKYCYNNISVFEIHFII